MISLFCVPKFLPRSFPCLYLPNFIPHLLSKKDKNQNKQTYDTFENNDIMKLAVKWKELKTKIIPEWGNTKPGIQAWYVLTHKWLLAIQ